MSEELQNTETEEVTEKVQAEEVQAEEVQAAEAAPEAPKPVPEELLPGAIEGILFSMGEAVSLSRLCDALGKDKRTVRAALKKLEQSYESEERGIALTWFEDSVQLCTKPEHYDYLIRLTKSQPKFTLTDSVLETLSIIAYKQPVTRVEIEKVRGVSCDHAINKLLEYDLIRELGRLDAPGKPLLFGTTEQFLRSFGVSSLDDLPELNPVQVEEFKKQAEEEIQVKLDI
ncbi:MAG: SMC-Scp complex subunit ScpB [Lachnospiraceae bacterium]|nr:SMC-Scp complex subunit ScpB [Lachnospiraceae bacterium]